MKHIVRASPVNPRSGREVEFLFLGESGLEKVVRDVPAVVVSRDFLPAEEESIKTKLLSQLPDAVIEKHTLGKYSRFWLHGNAEDRHLLEPRDWYCNPRGRFIRRKDLHNNEELDRLRADFPDVEFETYRARGSERILARGHKKHVRDLGEAGDGKEQWTKTVDAGIDHLNLGGYSRFIRTAFPVGMAFNPERPTMAQVRFERWPVTAEELRVFRELALKQSAVVDLEWRKWRKNEPLSGELTMGVLSSSKEHRLYARYVDGLPRDLHPREVDGTIVEYVYMPEEIVQAVGRDASRYSFVAGLNLNNADLIQLAKPDGVLFSVVPEWGVRHDFIAADLPVRLRDDRKAKIVQSKDVYALFRKFEGYTAWLDEHGIKYTLTAGPDDREISIIELGRERRAFIDPLSFFVPGNVVFVDLLPPSRWLLPELGSYSLEARVGIKKIESYDLLDKAYESWDVGAERKNPKGYRAARVSLLERALRYTSNDWRVTHSLMESQLPVQIAASVLLNTDPSRLAKRDGRKNNRPDIQDLCSEERAGEHLRVTKTHRDRWRFSHGKMRQELLSRPSAASMLESIAKDAGVRLSTPHGLHQVTTYYPMTLMHAFRDVLLRHPVLTGIAAGLSNQTPEQRLMSIHLIDTYLTGFYSKLVHFIQVTAKGSWQLKAGHAIDAATLYGHLTDDWFDTRNAQDWKFGQAVEMKHRDIVFHAGTWKGVSAVFQELNNNVHDGLQILKKSFDGPVQYCSPLVLAPSGTTVSQARIAEGVFYGLGEGKGVFASESIPGPLYLGMRESKSAVRIAVREALLHGGPTDAFRHCKRYEGMAAVLGGRGAQLSLDEAMASAL